MKLPVAILLLSLSPCAANSATVSDMLTRALLAGDVKIIENLLANGAAPNAPDRYGETPLALALSSNQPAIVELLLAAHADPNGRLNALHENGEFPVTPLQLAAQSGNIRIASALLRDGAHINSAGPSGRTALRFAFGHLDMLRFLLDQSADPNMRDAEGASALDDAAWGGSLDVAAILLAHGAKVNDPDAQTGATPLSEAAYRGHADVVRFLLQLHPDLDSIDKRGYTALDNAIRMGKEECAILLLDAHPPQRLEPLLERAVAADLPSLTETLLTRGADPNRGVLEDATLKGRERITAILLDHGADVNLVDPVSGTTALYAAASFGKTPIVKLLLERGADSGVCGRNRKTPWQAALDNAFTETAALLSAHACK